jgi:hypothetical protein
VGEFKAPLVVTYRPIPRDLVQVAVRVRFFKKKTDTKE